MLRLGEASGGGGRVGMIDCPKEYPDASQSLSIGLGIEASPHNPRVMNVLFGSSLYDPNGPHSLKPNFA